MLDKLLKLQLQLIQHIDGYALDIVVTLFNNLFANIWLKPHALLIVFFKFVPLCCYFSFDLVNFLGLNFEDL